MSDGHYTVCVKKCMYVRAGLKQGKTHSGGVVPSRGSFALHCTLEVSGFCNPFWLQFCDMATGRPSSGQRSLSVTSSRSSIETSSHVTSFSCPQGERSTWVEGRSGRGR